MTDKSSNTVTQSELDDIIRKHLTFARGKMGGARAVLKFKDLSCLHFRHADLSNADFTGSDLTQANLSKGIFNGTAFYSCNMTGADLSYAVFSRADMRGADLTDANLTAADLNTADMRAGAKVEKQLSMREQKENAAKAQGVQDDIVIDYSQLKDKTPQRDTSLDLSKTEKNKSLNSDFVLTGTQKTAEEDRLSALDLSKQEGIARESHLVLKNSEKDSESERLSALDLTPKDDAKIRQSDLSLTPDEILSRESNLILKQGEEAARQSDLVLQGQNDTAIPSTGLNLGIDADELHIKFQNHAKWINSAGTAGHQLDFSGLDMRLVKDVGFHSLIMCKASNADFSGLLFLKTQMESSNFDGSNFSNAKMKESDFRGSSLKRANFENADLTGCNFSPLKLQQDRLLKTNLSGANLRHANLTKARLRNANLSGADLTGANLTDADLRDADLTDAIMPDKA